MKRLIQLFSFILLCICLFLNACSIKSIPHERLMLSEETSKLQEYDYTQFSHKDLLEKIKALNKEVKNTIYTAPKYDELINKLTPLLEQYKTFKALEINRDTASFVIQPNSKTTFKFKTYCLQSGKAAPNENEQFILRKDSPAIPLYKDIAIYTNSKEKINSSIKQHLLWNLRNNIKFEDLPIDQQTFLLKMDPASYLKVNSVIKSEFKSQLTKYAKSQIPFYSQTADTIQMVKGKAYTYQEYARNVESLVSKLKLSDNINPIKSDGYDVYTQTKSSGYAETKITFINTTALKQFISCFSFLDPLREDIQPIGFDMPETYEEYEQYKDDIDREFENLLVTILKITGMGTEGEAKTIKNNPARILDLIKADKDRKIAFTLTEKNFSYNGRNDESDAFRHVLWNALMVRDIGEFLAEEIATNHELAQAPLKEKNMDLHNNKIGREIGQKLKDAGITSDEAYAKEVLANKDSFIVIEPRKK